MATNSDALDEVVKVMGALATGDLTQRITSEYRGSFAKLRYAQVTRGDERRSLQEGLANAHRAPPCWIAGRAARLAAINVRTTWRRPK